MTPDEETLARQLMAAGRLTPEQLARCQALAAQRGVGLGQVFTAYGLVPPPGLTRSLLSDSQGPGWSCRGYSDRGRARAAAGHDVPWQDGFGPWGLGSMAETVLRHCRCPLLLVPQRSTSQ